MSSHEKITEALHILTAIGMPRYQQNERSALCLLALLNLTPEKQWAQAGSPLIGITPMIEFSRSYYAKEYAPNTRETFRRQTMHQFVQAGLALYNPDHPTRPTNSPKAVYQIEPFALNLMKTYGTISWVATLKTYLSGRQTLVEQYARKREQHLIPITVAEHQPLQLSPGEHGKLIKLVIEEFAPRFVSGSTLIYFGDTGDKWGYFDEKFLAKLGVRIDTHGKMPDVIFYYPKKNWLLLIECVTSHGPVDSKRHLELARLFASAKPGLVYVTAFPTRSLMTRYLSEIAWETEVWVADAPSHLIHFNGDRFLGPY